MGKKVKDVDGTEIDIEQMLQDLLKTAGKDGQGDTQLARVMAENFSYRRKNAALTQQLEESGDALPEGAIVLQKADADKWIAYTSLGSPEDLKKTTETLTTAQGELDSLKHEQLINFAATNHGYKPTVLGDLVKARGLKLERGELEVKDEKTNETVKRPAAFVVDASGQKKPLHEVVKSDFGDYLPALSMQGQAQQQTGAPWVQQLGGGGGEPPKPNNDLAGKVNGYLDGVYANPTPAKKD